MIRAFDVEIREINIRQSRIIKDEDFPISKRKTILSEFLVSKNRGKNMYEYLHTMYFLFIAFYLIYIILFYVGYLYETL